MREHEEPEPLRTAPHASRRVLPVLVSALTLSALIPMAATPVFAAGSVSLTAAGATYGEPFDSLATSGTTNTNLPNGWELREVGTAARVNGAYGAGTGSENAGDVYSFGAAGVAERAFGTLLSGTLTPSIGASFTNNTGTTITSARISYVGEQWRLGQNIVGRGPDRLDFQISSDATSLATGNWVNQDSLDFFSPVLAGTVGTVNGNVAPNRTSLDATVGGLAVAPGATFWIRWLDADLSGSDDGLAVDEFFLTPFDADGAPVVSATTPAAAAANVATASNVQVTFNEPVTVSGSWFSIGCTTSGTHTAIASGGPSTYTLDPDTDFASNESCTVTISAAQVTDADLNDPPDAMAADHTWSFTTATFCGDPATLISAIQGSGAVSGMPNGTRVEIEGVVVGDFQASTSFNGFHVQEEDADADDDAATSEGIFVFEGGSAVDVVPGQLVRVSGEVSEFLSSGQPLTQITNVSRVLPCAGEPTASAADVSLPFASPSFAERYESMLVDVDQTLTVTETFGLGRFGELVLSSGGRLMTPTAVVEPGAPAQALQAENDLRRIVLDDGDNRQNLDPTRYPQGGLSASNTLRVGDTLDGGEFVLEQRFGLYRLQPTDAYEFSHDNERPASPHAVGGNLQVSAMNVLNYFTTLDTNPGSGNGPNICGPAASLECRGASTSFEFQRQRTKIIQALLGLDADIVGLMEIENNPSAAVADLVQGLNDATAPGTWAYIDTGTIGTDAIKLALIYRPAAVSPVGAHAILDSSVDPRFIDTRNRPALAQTFELAGDAGRLTVVVNHLKSKGSPCTGAASAPLDDPDTGDGSGNCNLTRKLAAQALVDWIATDPTASGDRDVLVIGDLNSYTKEEPIDVFVNAGYVDAIAAHAEDPYSYVFQGQTGYLDHALASPTLAPQITGATEWHINADEPPVLDYNTDFKSANHVNTLYAPDQYRSSDHDPLLVGIQVLDYDFAGFQPPLANPPATNEVRAGAVLPVKFGLGGNRGLDVMFGSPEVFLCADWPLGTSEPAASAGRSGLSYDAATDTYVYRWRAETSEPTEEQPTWAGSCRTLEVTFDDGTYRTAIFEFKP